MASDGVREVKESACPLSADAFVRPAEGRCPRASVLDRASLKFFRSYILRHERSVFRINRLSPDGHFVDQEVKGTLKIIVTIIILSSLFFLVSFFYNKQLGAIPFLLLSIVFIGLAWKVWNNKSNEQKKDGWYEKNGKT
ncbi:hypothetical protein [Caldibacillus debilis]|uniref:hypothetical protein n=1 Tax=Caldibacillus debilis TaxID=301148 RepID=UPI000B551B36|nr:hypothetical protein [Caldibacillus debilis]OUM84879.1 MAG: hypothetical protein BAA03_03340 [Caldibacillus debilis]